MERKERRADEGKREKGRERRADEGERESTIITHKTIEKNKITKHTHIHQKTGKKIKIIITTIRFKKKKELTNCP